ncbi:hypothetical protein [Hyperthermus butylicus]|uniref:hypothetical protein n=1 Tax=Hyperthermus butylicus TaxID=54248 RepID=UPI00129BCBA4|nr:hypothetical protein [Hyperthermus butylicus]
MSWQRIDAYLRRAMPGLYAVLNASSKTRYGVPFAVLAVKNLEKAMRLVEEISPSIAKIVSRLIENVIDGDHVSSLASSTLTLVAGTFLAS